MNHNETDDPNPAEAEALLDRMEAEGKVELTALGVLQLCALGAASQVFFDSAAAKIWFGRSQQERDEVSRSMLAGLEEMGQLYVTENPELGPGALQYRFRPELGLVMAARARPSFVITCGIDRNRHIREPNLFALGDQTNPVRGIVVEIPEAAPPGHEAKLARMGPFGLLYRYILATQAYTAELLAEWAMLPAPTPKPKVGKPPARTISMFRHDAGHPATGFRLAVRSDGVRARLHGRQTGEVEVPDTCDQAELTALMHVFLGIRPQP